VKAKEEHTRAQQAEPEYKLSEILVIRNQDRASLVRLAQNLVVGDSAM
jgi:hypothetical protein